MGRLRPLGNILNRLDKFWRTDTFPLQRFVMVLHLLNNLLLLGRMAAVQIGNVKRLLVMILLCHERDLRISGNICIISIVIF